MKTNSNSDKKDISQILRIRHVWRQNRSIFEVYQKALKQLVYEEFIVDYLHRFPHRKAEKK